MQFWVPLISWYSIPTFYQAFSSFRMTLLVDLCNPCAKLATHSATASDVLQTSFQGQVQDVEHENGIHFHIQYQMTGYRISSRNNISTPVKMVPNELAFPGIPHNHDFSPGIWPSRSYARFEPSLETKMVSNDGQLHQAAYTSMAIDLQDQRTGYRISSRNYVSACKEMVSNDG